MKIKKKNRVIYFFVKILKKRTETIRRQEINNTIKGSFNHFKLLRLIIKLKRS